MSTIADVRARFENLLEQYNLPRDAFEIKVDDSESWLFVHKEEFLGESDYAIWMQCVDAYGTDVPDDLPFEAFAIEDLPQAPAEVDTDEAGVQTALPETTMSTESLEDAHRMLTGIQDAQLEEDGEVSSWILAARRAVQLQLGQRDDD
jgi:hypothetical protein